MPNPTSIGSTPCWYEAWSSAWSPRSRRDWALPLPRAEGGEDKGAAPQPSSASPPHPEHGVVPLPAGARELNDNPVAFTSARIEFWAVTGATLGSGSSAAPLSTIVIPVAQRVPRLGTARLSASVTLPRDLARNASTGRLGLRVL